MKDEVLLKFHQDFHSSYKGEDYNVEFSLKRQVSIKIVPNPFKPEFTIVIFIHYIAVAIPDL